MKSLFTGVDSASCPITYSLVETLDSPDYTGSDIFLNVTTDG